MPLDKEQELKLCLLLWKAQYADNQFKSVQALEIKLIFKKLSKLDVQQTPLGTDRLSSKTVRVSELLAKQQITLLHTN